jgi:hypothetical protein
MIDEGKETRGKLPYLVHVGIPVDRTFAFPSPTARSGFISDIEIRNPGITWATAEEDNDTHKEAANDL